MNTIKVTHTKVNKRWLECAFFLFCLNIIRPTKDPKYLLQLITGANFTQKYNDLILHDLVTDFFILKKNRPHLLELIILREKHPNAITINKIKQLTKQTNADIERAIYAIRKNKLSIKTLSPKYNTETHSAIQIFFKQIQNIKSRVGDIYAK